MKSSSPTPPTGHRTHTQQPILPMASALPIPKKTDILTSYRHLLRPALRAVHFAYPQRYVVRDVLREAFRDYRGVETYDRKRIRNTIFFLNSAAHEAGLESRVLKSLV